MIHIYDVQCSDELFSQTHQDNINALQASLMAIYLITKMQGLIPT